MRSVIQYGRHNLGKVALFTVTTGGVVAAATYLRRQVSYVNDTVHAERLEGARKLQSVFMSNSQSICAAFRNLLPKLRYLLAECAAVDTSVALSRLRERPSDPGEKHALWQQVKLASITHLCSAVYLTALLYSFLSLQMNLLARYNVTDDALFAPVQTLPAGPLTAGSSKCFLDLVLRVVLDEHRVDHIVKRMEQMVQSATADINLGDTPSMEEIENLLSKILNNAWNGTQNCENDGEHFPDMSLSAMLHECLFDDVGRDCENREQTNSDVNYSWLIGECLDLCEVLDFNSVVHGNIMVCLSYVMWRMRNDMETEDGYKLTSFARLLARFSSMASTVMTCQAPSSPADPNNETAGGAIVSPTGTGNDCLDRWLCKDGMGTHFAASVFLSGEKESSVGMSDQSFEARG